MAPWLLFMPQLILGRFLVILIATLKFDIWIPFSG